MQFEKAFAYIIISKIVGCAPKWVKFNARGAYLTLGNRYRYTIFIDNGLIYKKWGCKNFLFPWGFLQKIIKKH